MWGSPIFALWGKVAIGWIFSKVKAGAEENGSDDV
jgi:hypothetical protein